MEKRGNLQGSGVLYVPYRYGSAAFPVFSLGIVFLQNIAFSGTKHSFF
ncbi:hypothetical protein [uncultured Mediterranea sp.]|nr:hypothetical protein [uncultured Mediterranea sp.]